MTVAQLVIAKELDAEIRRINGVVTDLENITSDLTYNSKNSPNLLGGGMNCMR